MATIGTNSDLSPKVLLAGLFHETHSFMDEITPLAAFQLRTGQEIMAAHGDGSPLDGFLEVAEAQGWQVIPAVDMRATPSAVVADAVLKIFWNHLETCVNEALADGLDAVYLVLHGAFVCESEPDVEGELLDRLRGVVGSDVPIFGVFDLHANLSARMARYADALVGYTKNPHTDAREAAVRAANLLTGTLQTGVIPRMFLRQAPVMWPPTGTGTAFTPMKDLEALARRLEKENPHFLAVSVAAGFSFADTPDTGASFLLVCTDDKGTEEALGELEFLTLSLKEQGNKLELDLETVLDQVLPVEDGPVVLAEPSDNIGAGAPGDCTGLLRALLARNVNSFLMTLSDPEAVKVAQTKVVRETFEIAVGGKGSRFDPGPVTLEVDLVSLSDGRFELEDPHSHLASMSGLTFGMGDCAVVRSGGATLLLTSERTPPFDLGQYRSQGIEPADFDIIGVKAAVAYRQTYDTIAKANYSVETPGPCSSNLKLFPYQRLRRPIYPLELGI